MKGEKRAPEFYLKKAALGTVMSVVMVFLLLGGKGSDIFGEVFFYDNVPGYEIKEREGETEAAQDVFNGYVQDEKRIYEEVDVKGKKDISFIESESGVFSDEDKNRLKDLSVLKKNFYIVDKKTSMTKDYFDVDKFLAADLKIGKEGDKPKVLIFHTHSKEMFKDSKPDDLSEGIVGAGDRLASVLENKYGIKCIHNRQSFDVVNGRNQVMGAYERMEPVIRKVIEDNPSVELVIDLHRDGIDESKKLVTTINGKPTAKIMFFNGICRILNQGQLTETPGLANPYIPVNLALSFNMQIAADKKYPGFSRGIYLNAYRYSLHMKPKSMLIEMGAQNNTKEEIYNSVDILAEILNDVVG